MANETYTLIQKTTVGSGGAASIEFTSIPQTFTDLIVKLSTRGSYAGGGAANNHLTFNSSVTNYSDRYLSGDGATASSATQGTGTATRIFAGFIENDSWTADTFGNFECYIPNYTSANFKSVSIDTVTEYNATGARMNLIAALLSNTAAITSITFTPETGNFMEYSTATLYGVAKEGVTPTGFPKASGGDIITNDGTYWIHQFLNSGTFTPSQTLSTEYLVIAGGGGAGANTAGGAGGGGYRTASGFSVTAQPYAITVGAGGSGATAPPATYANGTKGSNSVFSTITSTGGALGPGQGNGTTGGSGSGGAGGSGFSTTGGAGNEGGFSPVEGFAGGTGINPGPYSGGGGGGAGSVGGDGSAGGGGNGGSGTASSITGTSVTRAGGGGGASTSTGGTASGGGGAGGTAGVNGSAGTINTGGGGGGGYQAGESGGAGGSGIVIIRYAI
jgi:hypothetical protein